MATTIGIVKVKILKFSRHIHVQKISKTPQAFDSLRPFKKNKLRTPFKVYFLTCLTRSFRLNRFAAGSHSTA